MVCIQQMQPMHCYCKQDNGSNSFGRKYLDDLMVKKLTTFSSGPDYSNLGDFGLIVAQETQCKHNKDILPTFKVPMKSKKIFKLLYHLCIALIVTYMYVSGVDQQ